MIDPIALTQDLIRCPSVTPEDAGALQVLIDALTPLGFECHVLPFGNIQNLFARRGFGKTHLCFLGHTDVVPVGDAAAWTHPPFSAVIEGDKLFGRGASDMKGGIACFVAALAQNLPEHGSISLLITGDEEGEAKNGTIKVLEWMAANNHIPDVFLGGEPTNPDALGDEIKVGRRGSTTGFLTVVGKQGHNAYPQQADNPLPRLVKMLDALVSFKFDNGNDFFPPTDLQLVSIDVGNPTENVIPAKGSAIFKVRFNDQWSGNSLEVKLREMLNSVSSSYTLQTICYAESFITKPNAYSAMMSAAVEKITGRKPALTTSGGTSDARFAVKYAPVVECGAVNRTIHQVDEFALLDDLRRLTKIYGTFLQSFFAQSEG